MIKIFINHKTYLCPETCSELSWRQFFLLTQYLQRKKQNLNRLKLARKVLTALTRVNHNTASKINKARCMECIDYLAERLTIINASQNKLRTPPKQFLCKNEMWVCPQSVTLPDKQRIHLVNTSAYEFCLASDLFIQNPWQNAPLITAILCRPAGENFNELSTFQNVRKTENAPLNIITNLFKQIALTHKLFKQKYPFCFHQNNNSPRSTATVSWNDLLLWTGNCKINEIERLKTISCHQFMELVNAKLLMQA